MKKYLLILLLITIWVSTKAQTPIDTTNSEWEYDTKVDEMTGNKSYLVNIASDPSTTDGIIAEFDLRYSKDGNEVIFGIRDGLINSRANGLPISVKFDDGKIEKFQAIGSSTNEYKIFFIQQPSKFITELKASKKLLIQVELYGKGNVVFHFNTRGLKWNYK